jgi:hypothetical protein
LPRGRDGHHDVLSVQGAGAGKTNASVHGPPPCEDRRRRGLGLAATALAKLGGETGNTGCAQRWG